MHEEPPTPSRASEPPACAVAASLAGATTEREPPKPSRASEPPAYAVAGSLAGEVVAGAHPALRSFFWRGPAALTEVSLEGSSNAAEVAPMSDLDEETGHEMEEEVEREIDAGASGPWGGRALAPMDAESEARVRRAVRQVRGREVRGGFSAADARGHEPAGGGPELDRAMVARAGEGPIVIE